jgi:hypothetical protein
MEHKVFQILSWIVAGLIVLFGIGLIEAAVRFLTDHI